MRKIATPATPSTEAMFRALGLKRIGETDICREFFNPKEGLAPRRLVALIYGRYGASAQEVTDAPHLGRLREAGETVHYYSASPDQAEQLTDFARFTHCRAGKQSQGDKPIFSSRR